MPALAVVGGGITGLTAAWTLAQAGAEVVVFEARDRLGGVIRTDRVDAVPVEAGPDAFLAGDGVLSLCQSLDLEDDLISPDVFGAYIWSRGKLRRLPPGVVLGLPAQPFRALRAGLLSPTGAARAGAEVFVPGPLKGADVSVGTLIRRRFGPEVLERLVDPLMAGRRAGHTHDMSLRSADAMVDALARSHRSLLLGLRRERRAGRLAGGPPPFLTPRGGMERLVDALARGLRGLLGPDSIRTGAPVTRVRTRNGGMTLDLEGKDAMHADGVVVCVPAPHAAGLLRGLSDDASHELAGIPFASTAVVTFVYPPASCELPPNGSGFLVPSSEGKTLAACTWYSVKWPASAPSDGGIVLRAFVGRAGTDPALNLDDNGLATLLERELADALRPTAPPRLTKVARWADSLPEYGVGHAERVARIGEALEGHPRLALAGAAYRGSGIPDCVSGATAAARRVLAALAP
ncbi:MAG: protoporphyrinogen oxidase [Actinomycetota bacterium]|nr:protoporphyrinogen oxidase [Actinomycetota bacterium]